MPSCKTPRRRVKRLKALPAKWAELPLDQKKVISEELGMLQGMYDLLSYYHWMTDTSLVNFNNFTSEKKKPVV